jgi:uncharacterized glyoxalase superfamily protein PhnB
LAAVIPTAILVRPHRAAPANRTTDMESQVIPMIQDVMGQTLSSSHLGQRGASLKERLDLIIDGKSRSDLELYRTTLTEQGLPVDPIAQDKIFGHNYFQLVDPDGNGITVYTSHSGKLPV